MGPTKKKKEVDRVVHLPEALASFKPLFDQLSGPYLVRLPKR